MKYVVITPVRRKGIFERDMFTQQAGCSALGRHRDWVWQSHGFDLGIRGQETGGWSDSGPTVIDGSGESLNKLLNLNLAESCEQLSRTKSRVEHAEMCFHPFHSYLIQIGMCRSLALASR